MLDQITSNLGFSLSAMKNYADVILPINTLDGWLGGLVGRVCSFLEKVTVWIRVPSNGVFVIHWALPK